MEVSPLCLTPSGLGSSGEGGDDAGREELRLAFRLSQGTITGKCPSCTVDSHLSAQSNGLKGLPCSPQVEASGTVDWHEWKRLQKSGSHYAASWGACV